MSHGPIIVLVVEDEPLIRISAAMSLGEAGYTVLEAANADAAVVMLNANPEIRVVFTDVHMPGTMDGIALAAYVRDRWPPVVLIVTSGKATAADMDLPERARFIPKPYWDQAVVSAVGELLARA